MIRRLTLPIVVSLAVLAPGLCQAQGEGAPGAAPVADSIAVVGNKRNSAISVVQLSGLVAGRALNYRDIQRAIQALYGSGQFDDVSITQNYSPEKTVLVISVRERPQLLRWAVSGTDKLSEGSVRDKVTLAEGRPLDPAAAERSRARIDSLYHARGFYLAKTNLHYVYERDSSAVRVIYDIEEGRRVAIAQVDIQGNTHFSDAQIIEQMSSKPEGFWWFQSGEFNDDKLAEDLRQ